MLVIDDRYEVYVENEDSLEVDKLYKAKDLHLDSLVYIKIIANNKYMKESFFRNLIDESTMTLSMDSINIAKILRVGNYKWDCYIVSEYFEGENLFDIINNKRLKIKDLIFIARQIIIAMKICDQNNMYHGALRLDNILVNENQTVKIYDLGITKANDGINLRLNNNISFLCPHQLNVNYTDRESDFFAIGLILYYCLFKKMPFKLNSNEFEMLKNIDRGVHFDKNQITNSNKALIEIIKKLMDRKDKYKNYNEILIDLSEVMYAKANIVKNTTVDTNLESDQTENNIKKNTFFIKFISIIICIIILAIIILQM